MSRAVGRSRAVMGTGWPLQAPGSQPSSPPVRTGLEGVCREGARPAHPVPPYRAPGPSWRARHHRWVETGAEPELELSQGVSLRELQEHSPLFLVATGCSSAPAKQRTMQLCACSLG